MYLSIKCIGEDLTFVTRNEQITTAPAKGNMNLFENIQEPHYCVNQLTDSLSPTHLNK